ncbi:Sgd1p [Rhodotorula paludigena]|uniref:Sgd1p n=1 Tax=Rhodotorula paludigena TaxID=86838 RepID=UPI00317D81EA
MPPKHAYNHAARKRTATLPAKLRDELEQLGHLEPKSTKSRLGRKDRRKAERGQAKQNRANHQQQQRKRPAAQDAAVEPQPAPPKREAVQSPRPTKRAREEPADEAQPPQKKKQTALEKLVSKQERGKGPDPASRRSKLDNDEDREIAWLEAKLGMQGKLTNMERKRARGEFADEGLEELFDGLDDLEGAAFGTSKKDYARMLAETGDLDDLPSDFDPAEFMGGADDSEDEFAGLGGDDASGDDAYGSYGVSDDELRNPSDDDDHEEMGELGSDESDGDEEMLRESDFDGVDEESDEEDGVDLDEDEAAPAAPAPAPTAAPAAVTAAPTTGRYVPPHLRKAAEAAAAAAAPAPTSAPSLDAPPEDPRLRRQLQGHLNKLSSANIGAILDALLALYRSNPRAVVSTTLTSLLLGTVSDRDNLGDQLVVTYAALVAALFRTVGIEFPAGVLARAIELFDSALSKHADTAHAAQTPRDGVVTEEEGFEGRPGSKECLNLVSLVSELYNFGVVHCGLVYDLVRLFIEGGLGELEVELLSRIVKRCGQQLRSDDPSALKDIISLVKQKMHGVDPASMNSRTRFMIEQLTNLKNNKLKQPGADGAVDHYSGLKKYLSGLNKKRASGAAPDPLRVSLSELRASSTRGKWWLVGAAWAGDPLAELDGGEASSSVPAKALQSKEAQGDKELARLARAQGMNTDVRKGVFNVLMSSEDYVDACERLLQLGLSDVQQREIARVLLQCCGNEKAYNPYYTLIAQRLCTKSHSFQITLQYLLWDFFRDLGESNVGGEEFAKSLDGDASGNNVAPRRIANLAKFYAWCLAKEALSLTVLKPIPFSTTLPSTLSFLQQLLVSLVLATQTPSPAFALPASDSTRKDRPALERVLIKSAAHARLQKGLGYYFEAHGKECVAWAGKKLGEREKGVVKWGVKVALETLSVSGIVTDF